MGENPAPEKVVPLWNIANVLTMSRLVLVAVLLVTLFVDHGQDITWRIVSTLVFAIACITDHIDGKLARSRGLVTNFGKLVDPIADKALIGAALIGLSILAELPWWATGVIAVREIGVTVLRFWVIRHGVIPASRGGKAKPLLQMLAIGAYLLPLSDVFALPRWVLLGAALVLTVTTGADYLVRAVRLRASATRVADRG